MSAYLAGTRERLGKGVGNGVVERRAKNVKKSNGYQFLLWFCQWRSRERERSPFATFHAHRIIFNPLESFVIDSHSTKCLSLNQLNILLANTNWLGPPLSLSLRPPPSIVQYSFFFLIERNCPLGLYNNFASTETTIRHRTVFVRLISVFVFEANSQQLCLLGLHCARFIFFRSFSDVHILKFETQIVMIIKCTTRAQCVIVTIINVISTEQHKYFSGSKIRLNVGCWCFFFFSSAVCRVKIRKTSQEC